MRFLNDDNFLSGIHGYERLLAKLLALLLAVVIGVGTLELLIEAISKTVSLQTNWFDGSLIKLLDRLLLIFIALEVLQNVTAYLRDQVVQIELVLLTALTAVARKVIVLPPGTENKPALMASFGLIVVGIAAAYWLVLMARRNNQVNSANH
ncbi:phosphate-starvation-inducible PsiE family protein [Vulcanococcus sp. Clear-D1]|uniref:phosphate-starvation-inducible PsiE family protein n=1 Tax=Vulcanococcus sp. Clear-D1 TaxID=2766970 RepID=UPI001992DBEF|nr:phosphate-starvation-inducible PsiE family protein [Vulcanococcus sp. Clear-D1]MBD1195424.1 phosphate-starvation-inducible PsiE family protein [Vulcanococcus sp. Clear-D1]